MSSLTEMTTRLSTSARLWQSSSECTYPLCLLYPNLSHISCSSCRETKTVNAWFQNKRASTKKRHRGGPAPTSTNPNLDLPPISAILASTPGSSSSAPSRSLERDTYDADFHVPTLPPPRINKHSVRPHQVVVLEETPRQHSPFYAGNADHHHSFDRGVTPPPVDLPARPRMRMRPSSQQTDELRKFYQVNPHPTKEEREELGQRIGM